jgi:hypothetical protein
MEWGPSSAVAKKTVPRSHPVLVEVNGRSCYVCQAWYPLLRSLRGFSCSLRPFALLLEIVEALGDEVFH